MQERRGSAQGHQFADTLQMGSRRLLKLRCRTKKNTIQKKKRGKKHLSLHPSSVVSPIPPASSRPTQWCTRLVGVSCSSLMIPLFVIINIFVIDAFFIDAFEASEMMLPGRPSTPFVAWPLTPCACGVPEPEAPGRSLGCGEKRPWRSIRCLFRKDC